MFDFLSIARSMAEKWLTKLMNVNECPLTVQIR